MLFMLILLLGTFPLGFKDDIKWGAIPQIERSISFNSGYLTSLEERSVSNSNVAWSQFSQEIQMAQNKGFDSLKGTAWGKKNPGWLLWLNGIVLNAWVTQAQMTTYHETGHWSRMRAYGASEPYFTSFWDMEASNPALLFLEQMIAPFMHHAATVYGTKRDFKADIPDTPANKERLSYMASAAGVNNSMRFADDMAERSYANQGHIMDVMPYMRGKLETVFYDVDYKATSGNDMVGLLNYYKYRGWDITKGNIDLANYLSFFLSAPTYGYVLAWYNQIVNGDGRVKPLELWGIRAPEVSAYYIDAGISYRIKTGYRIDPTFHLWGAVEFVAQGGSGAEGSLGFEKRFRSLADLSFGGSVYFGRAWTGEIHARVPLPMNLFLEGAAEYAHLKSFYGQRNVASLESGEAAWAFYLRGGWRY